LSAGQQFGTNRSVFSPRPITIQSYVDDHQRGPSVPLPSSPVLAMSTPSRSKSKVGFPFGTVGVAVWGYIRYSSATHSLDPTTRSRDVVVDLSLDSGHQANQVLAGFGLLTTPS
jgi:hypothetical protein